MISFKRRKLLRTVGSKYFTSLRHVLLVHLDLHAANGLREDPVESHKMVVQNDSRDALCL